MPRRHTLIYEFGDFGVDAAERRRRGRGGEPVPLTTRAFETLLYLLGRAGTVLDKDELKRPGLRGRLGFSLNSTVDLRRSLLNFSTAFTLELFNCRGRDLSEGLAPEVF